MFRARGIDVRLLADIVGPLCESGDFFAATAICPTSSPAICWPC